MYRSIVIFQMKQTTIVGNIGRDAVCREGDGGHKFVSFSVAYAERKTNDTDEQGNPVTVAQWAECEIYVGPESSAEGLLKLLTKGRFIYIFISKPRTRWKRGSIRITKCDRGFSIGSLIFRSEWQTLGDHKAAESSKYVLEKNLLYLHYEKGVG